MPSILGDERFKVMFENPDYQVDEQSEEFRLLNPIVSKVGQKRKKKLRFLAQQAAASQQVRLNLVMTFFIYIRFLNSVDFKDEYLINNVVTSLTRQLASSKMRRSLRGKLALRKRAQMTTRVGWRR